MGAQKDSVVDDVEPISDRDIVVERETEPIQFGDYTDKPTDKRQLFWLSFTSTCLAKYTSSDSRVLDIGSNLHWLAGVAAGRTVEMVDIRPHPLAEVLPFQMHVANATSLPFAPNSFDAVTFPQLLHWVGTGTYGDPVNLRGDQETLAEVARVLRSGGIGIFTTFVVPGPTVVKLNGRRLFGLSDLEERLSDCGLEIAESELRNPVGEPIDMDSIPARSGRVLVPGNPDEDLAWAIFAVRKR